MPHNLSPGRWLHLLLPVLPSTSPTRQGDLFKAHVMPTFQGLSPCIMICYINSPQGPACPVTSDLRSLHLKLPFVSCSLHWSHPESLSQALLGLGILISITLLQATGSPCVNLCEDRPSSNNSPSHLHGSSQSANLPVWFPGQAQLSFLWFG